MTAISFTIIGRLPGWGRARVDARGGRPKFFMDRKTRGGELIVRTRAREAMRRERAKIIAGAVELSVAIFLNPPKSWPKKKREAAIAARYVTGKPDADNILKLIGDAMNNLVYRDDSQIARILFARYYTTGTECVHIDVCEAAE